MSTGENIEPHDQARAAAISLVESVCDQLKLDSVGVRLADVLNDLTAVCFVKDRTGALAYAGPGLADLDPTVTSDSAAAADPDSVQLAERTDRIVLEEARAVSYRHQVRTGEGSTRSVLTQKLPLVGRDAQTVGLLGVCRETSGHDSKEGQIRSGLLGLAPNVNVRELREQLSRLDDRERELAQLISHGAINKQLATHFDVSVRSVENWRRMLLSKLELETVPELTRWVARLEDYGLLPTA